MEGNDFTANLKFLCGHYKSVAEVCRRLEINRQQFNKYLGGQSIPSPYNLRKICEFFGVDEGEIYEPHDTFLQIFSKSSPVADHSANLGKLSPDLFPESTAQLRKYLGYYHVYVVTPSRPGHFLKSVAHFYEKEGAVHTKTLEVLRTSSEKFSASFVNKYNGFCFFSSQILYLVESEYLNSRGYIYTALYPSFRSPVDLLNGLVLGISGGNFRMPYSSQIVFEHLGETPNLREAVSKCGFLPFESDEISESVRSRLLVPISPTDFNISAPIL